MSAPVDPPDSRPDGPSGPRHDQRSADGRDGRDHVEPAGQGRVDRQVDGQVDRTLRRGRIRPLDEAVEAMLPVMSRAVPEPSSLSERAARVLDAGPADALSLMREVCRVDRLKAVAAARMADVLLGSRPDFVQLDDDRWALLRDGQIVRGRDDSTAGSTVVGDAMDDDTGEADGDGATYGDSDGTKAGANNSASDSTNDGTAPVTGHTTPAALRVRSPRTRADLSPTLKSMRFAVVDVETTGSHTNGADRITEIAIVPVEGLQVGEPWEQLVQPGKLIPPFIQALTGISNAMVAQAPMFHEIADEVIARLDGQMFTAHNAAFDRRFVASELLRTRHIFLDGQSLCTVRLARRLLPTLPRRSLDRVCEHFGIANAGRHRAGGDALATAHCLVRMLHIAHDDGLTTWAQLQRFLSGPTRRSVKRSALPSPVREDTSA